MIATGSLAAEFEAIRKTKTAIHELFDEIMQDGLETPDGQLILPDVRPDIVACITQDPLCGRLGRFMLTYLPYEDLVKFTRLEPAVGNQNKILPHLDYNQRLGSLMTSALELNQSASIRWIDDGTTRTTTTITAMRYRTDTPA